MLNTDIPKPLRWIFYGFAVCSVLITLFIGGYYILGIGRPAGRGAQGAYLEGLRGGLLYLVTFPERAEGRELLLVYDDHTVSRYVVKDRGPIKDDLHENVREQAIADDLWRAAEAQRAAWCQGATPLPDTQYSPTVYQVLVACSPLTSRIMYLPPDQLPPVLKTLMALVAPTT